jgi:glycosyltransferase involved in cell wall biosynthesis
MIFLNLPIGSEFGWGILGKHIARELARLEPTRLLNKHLNQESVGDPFDWIELRRLLLTPHEVACLKTVNGVTCVDGPLIQRADDTLSPKDPTIRGDPNIGYSFSEENIIRPEYIENGRRLFNRIVTGSTWWTGVLTANGLPNVATAIQGVDRATFSPRTHGNGERDYFREEFVVFSGGKFEFRKGQDIVIRAFKILQDRHRDVMLINAWHNFWPESIQTMRYSPLIRFEDLAGAYVEGVNKMLAENGIDLERVITLPLVLNIAMPRIYRNTDVGLFPSRCEGGTNLVLMEYMACGKPVIATNTTGHSDIVTPANSLIIKIKGEGLLKREKIPVARWPEPDLDDVIDKLEWSYQNRNRLPEMGRQAADDLTNRTWRHTAAAFQQIIRETSLIA